MPNINYHYIATTLSKAICSIVRIYHNGKLLDSSSSIEINPDPFVIYANEVLDNTSKCGLFTTPLFQQYGFFDISYGYRIVIGPTGLLAKDQYLLDLMMFELDLPSDKIESYLDTLQCFSHISMERFTWLISFLIYTFTGEEVSVDKIVANQSSNINTATPSPNPIIAENSRNQSHIESDYKTESALMSFVRYGQVDKLVEISSAPPSLDAGQMAYDTLRQLKNTVICCATVASRHAIAGGVEPKVAFAMSNNFVQTVETLTSITAISKLPYKILVDYATQVHNIKYGITCHSPFLTKCRKYIASRITTVIKVSELAKELNISRSYLCTIFKQDTGITLSQFILQEKILEAERLLSTSPKALVDIANYLSFSSQSHFQNTFKKTTGITPKQYRDKMN